jgi:hypothetical protein
MTLLQRGGCCKGCKCRSRDRREGWNFAARTTGKNTTRGRLQGSLRPRVPHKVSRVGRNPKTGARVEVPAKLIPYFKPSKELKDFVNAESTGGHSGPQETTHP